VERLFARLFNIVAGKEYRIAVQWSTGQSSHFRPLQPSLRNLVLGCAGLLLVGVGFFVWEIGRYGAEHITRTLEVSRSETLVKEFRNLQATMASVEKQLDSALHLEHRVRALYGLNSHGEAGGHFGIGGRKSEQEKKPSGVLHEQLFSTAMKSRQLQGRLEYSWKNFQQMNEFIQYRQNLWNHTPSILPAKGSWTSGFGYRTHPVTGAFAMHEGLDIAGNQWTPIYASADGIILRSGKSGNFGNLVEIDHGNGYVTRYGHMTQVSVNRGELIKRYSLLGYMGKTGRATGTHLHYEVLRDDKPLNPELYILPSGLLVD
jgi:murein DD-endopeptidase MepM/ murein hydrolase activator NlpD